MLAHWRAWRGLGADPARELAVSLGTFAGRPAASWAAPGRAWSFLDGPRPPVSKPGAWRPAITANGTTAVVHGWIDNAAEIAAELGVEATDLAEVLAAAVERWGAGADRHLIGSYCAIVELPDGTLRLSRSPWTAPPLLYANDHDHAVVASVPRALFAAGVPQKLNVLRFADNLYYNQNFTDEGWHEGTRRVPQGSVVTLKPGKSRVEAFYDPLEVRQTRLRSDDEYLEGASALLAEATAKALAGTRRPGIALSGGLDSAIVADEILRQLPSREVLRSFTAIPGADWDGRVAPGGYGDERPWVEAFAATHPQLRASFIDRPGSGFDDRADEMLRAMGIAPRNFTNLQFYHAVFAGAREAGCDLLLDAELGNDTFSHDGRWCYVEYLRTGRWGQLRNALASRPDDERPMWRRFAALSLLRLLPARVRHAIRRVAHPERRDFHALWHLVSPAAVERLGLEERRGSTGRLEFEYWASREEAVRYSYACADFEGAEVWQGLEQVHGLRRRDVTAYRPLIEFCIGLPTDQFVRDGEDRRLARRLAKGRMPEAQRTNRRYGRHHADWHARLTPKRGELRALAERIREDPLLGEIVDVERMIALLDDWPEHTPLDPESSIPREVALTRAAMAAHFIRQTTGSNTL